MGWASGSSILDDLADRIMLYVPRENKAIVADALVDVFASEDCDTIGECVNPEIKKAYLRYLKENP